MRCVYLRLKPEEKSRNPLLESSQFLPLFEVFPFRRAGVDLCDRSPTSSTNLFGGPDFDQFPG